MFENKQGENGQHDHFLLCLKINRRKTVNTIIFRMFENKQHENCEQEHFPLCLKNQTNQTK